MRSKEDAHDYRYFPEPDLLPVRTAERIDSVRSLVPELPHEKVARFEDHYQITHYDASVLASDLDLATYYEAAANGAKSAKKVANWVINDLLASLKEREETILQCPIAPDKLGAIINLIETGTISNGQAKEILAALFNHPEKAPEAIAKEKGFEPADDSEVEGFIEQAIAANPGPAQEVADGNAKAANFLTGQVMKLSRGKANPKSVTEAILAKLQS